MYMTVIPLAEARAQLSRIIDDAVRTHQRVEVTRKGKRAAVILSADDFDSIIETLEILSDADVVRGLRQAEDQIERGEHYPLDQVREEMREKGRLPE